MTAIAEPDAAAPARRPRTGRRLVALGVALAVLALAVVASICVGSALLPLGTVWRAFTEPDGSTAQITVTEARVNRTVLGLVVGAALGTAGALIQALTRNPLADPGILGVNAGAAFAVVLGVAFFGVTSTAQYLPFALAGAVAASVLVYAIASGGTGAPSPARLTLVGIALGAVLIGISQTLALIDVETFDRMRFWMVGSITDRPSDAAAVIAPLVGIGLLLTVFVARPLNALALGEDLARTVGARIGPTRIVVFLAVTLLCGAATAAAGPISFVGLMVPHAVRWITGPDWRWILVFTVVLAPVLVLVSDVIGRVVVLPGELQVGIITALIGAPVLVVLVRRRRAAGL
ncbi:iron chelate uptake ABC transporter family permease subunit [Microbacterium sp. 18062]|uniref:iron chelate uptake ABC transporter family permease subunit n=1 Tax=Microbacterium sp. 18062 TaxID=2681410 RepID=UPI001F411BA1|nr:iron chelate uptake ABC transporter family permease subunit [Microbacterium sp. 18062]